MVSKSSGYQDKTELPKASLALAVVSTEPKQIINIFSQIALNQNKIVVNSIIKISNLVVGVTNDLNILSSHLTFLV